MQAPRKSLKPIYVQTIGQVRILVWPRRRGESARHSVVSIERTQDSTSPLWYPSASFSANDLADLESLLPVVRAFLDDATSPAGHKGAKSDPPETSTTAHASESTPSDAPEDEDEIGDPEPPSPEPSDSVALETESLSNEPTERLFVSPEEAVHPIARGHSHPTPVGRTQWKHRAILHLRACQQARREMWRA